MASVIGNIVVIIVKMHRKKLRVFNSGDLLIVNLAICDINKTWAVYVVWTYTNVVKDRWELGEISCTALQKIVVVLFSVTSVTLLVLTIERYYLIVKPLDRLFTLRRIQKLLALIWTLTILAICVPRFASFQVIQLDGVPNCIACDHDNVWVNLFEILYFVIIIFIPLIAISILSWKATKRLRKSMKSCCSQVKVSKNFNEKMRRNRNAINMLRSITFGGFLCYAPWAVSYLLQTHNRKALRHVAAGNILQPVFGWLIFGGFCNAPMTYFIFSKEFRKETKRVFLRRRKGSAKITTRIGPK